MVAEIFLFMLRFLLATAICGFVWTTVKPQTQSMRIMRAALLVVCLLVALAVLRGAGVG